MKAKDELARLKALNFQHATPEIFGATIREDAPDREQAEKHLAVLVAVLAEYLKEFVPPSNCICCGSRLGAKDAIDAFISADPPTFVWGLQHGEGTCSKCGYPARAMHYIGKTETEPEMITIRNFILQYHPSALTAD